MKTYARLENTIVIEKIQLQDNILLSNVFSSEICINLVDITGLDVSIGMALQLDGSFMLPSHPGIDYLMLVLKEGLTARINDLETTFQTPRRIRDALISDSGKEWLIKFESKVDILRKQLADLSDPTKIFTVEDLQNQVDNLNGPIIVDFDPNQWANYFEQKLNS